MSAPDIILPGTAHVVPPDPALHVVPAAGPPGPAGPQGPQGVAGASGGISTEDAHELIDDAMSVHVIDPEPHPAYDDLPSFRLLFENGLI